MDVKTEFLNRLLKEELYMMQPEGFVDPENADKVWKLQRSIYGLVKHLGVAIFTLMRRGKLLVLYKLTEKLVFTRK